MRYLSHRLRVAQPTGIPRVAWGNPITRDLVFAAIPIGPQFAFDAVDGKKLAPDYGTIGGTFSRSIDGGAMSPLGGERLRSSGTPSRYRKTGVREIFIRASPTPQLVASRTVSDIGDGFGIGFVYSAGTVVARIKGTNAATQPFEAVGATLLDPSKFYSISGFTHPASTTSQLWIDGRLDAAVNDSLWSGASASYISLVSYQATGNSPLKVVQICAWQRRLDDAERIYLHRNPWQVFA